MNRREIADFDSPEPAAAYTPASGRRTARPNFRVETLISIRFLTHCSSKLREAASCQLGSASSLPVIFERTRGRSSATLPPWNPTRPVVRPQR